MITVEFKDFEDMMGFARNLVSTVETREPVQTAAATVQPTQVTPPPVQEETQAEDISEEEKTYTMEEVRAKLAALNKAGKRSEVKALLAGFGAEKLSEIPEEKYTELMDKAGEI